jgi:hypothetical protein
LHELLGIYLPFEDFVQERGEFICLFLGQCAADERHLIVASGDLRFMNPTTIRIYATFPLSQGMSIMANGAGINGIKTPTHIHMDKDCFVGGRKLIFSPDALSARILP